MAEPYKYEGNELELFRHAKNWKSYFSKIIKPFIKGSVLEVGAGLGATTEILNDGSATSWMLLEPDDKMVTALQEKINQGLLPVNCFIKKGTTNEVSGTFDTIIYIDVLEHIKDDHEELKKAAALLAPAGHLVVLSPAFQSLYNPFDKAIGHYRRYTKKQLYAITPAELELFKCDYYDSTGYFAAGMNKILLKKNNPSRQQVLFWDRWMIPVSRLTDKIFFHRFGKSIIAFWRKNKGA
jgi:2-polyprenyl-3-methyl-5-hydroxy-6-metoxy-1,4-benzoquinol methylase